ncbi:MAG: glycosyltransferase [Chloroflexi bacterium]|nr:glycosyltransferase [Chloroflexota bacterium]
MTTVSIIMPVYNGERYLPQALDSVLAQTLRDWELLVVDDGSTDGTPGILARYTDPRITVLRQPNRGPAAARNAALERATGAYVVCWDGDDLFEPRGAEALARYLDEHPGMGAVIADAWVGDADGHPRSRLSEHRVPAREGDLLESLVLTSSVYGQSSCVMVRRELLARHAIRFDPDLRVGEDWLWLIEIARHARFGFLDAIVLTYRVHTTNITRTTGRSRRNSDLARLCFHIMHSGWFEELSLRTRAAFLYQLCTTRLEGNDDARREVLTGDIFGRLPADERSRVARRVATDTLAHGGSAGFARFSLEIAASANNTDARSRLMLCLTRRWPGLARCAVRAWAALLRAVARLRPSARRAPRPMPAELAPEHD